MKQLLLHLNTTFSAIGFTQQMPESSDSMYSSHSCMLENIWYNFTRRESNSHVQILLQYRSGPRAPINKRKFKISYRFGLHKVKIQYDMFSSMKIEEYMESELSGTFQIKLVAKNITELSLWCNVSFWRNLQMFWTWLLDL